VGFKEGCCCWRRRGGLQNGRVSVNQSTDLAKHRNYPQAVREIHVKGVRVPITPDLLGNVRPSTAATQTGLLALLNVQNGTQAERTRLLSESIYMMADEITTFLLEKNAVADSMALLECLNRGQGAEELWGRLLERAGKQESIVGRVGSIEHLVRALGGDWEERWKVYKAKFDGTEE